MQKNQALETDPSQPRGLYCYDTIAERGSCRPWRPDLVPAILAWLEKIPRCDWGMVRNMHAGMCGHFIIEFETIKRDSGEPVVVTVAFDHGMFAIQNGEYLWPSDKIVPYSYAAIYCAANIDAE